MRRLLFYLGLPLLAVTVFIIVLEQASSWPSRLVAEIWAFVGSAGALADRWTARSVAEVWASIDTNSLVGFGSLVENQIDADLWVDSILPLLTLPAWSLLAILGVIFLVIGAVARRKRQRPGS